MPPAPWDSALTEGETEAQGNGPLAPGTRLGNPVTGRHPSPGLLPCAQGWPDSVSPSETEEAKDGPPEVQVGTLSLADSSAAFDLGCPWVGSSLQAVWTAVAAQANRLPASSIDYCVG